MASRENLPYLSLLFPTLPTSFQVAGGYFHSASYQLFRMRVQGNPATAKPCSSGYFSVLTWFDRLFTIRRPATVFKEATPCGP